MNELFIATTQGRDYIEIEDCIFIGVNCFVEDDASRSYNTYSSSIDTSVYYRITDIETGIGLGGFPVLHIAFNFARWADKHVDWEHMRYLIQNQITGDSYHRWLTEKMKHACKNEVRLER